MKTIQSIDGYVIVILNGFPIDIIIGAQMLVISS